MVLCACSIWAGRNEIKKNINSISGESFAVLVLPRISHFCSQNLELIPESFTPGIHPHTRRRTSLKGRELHNRPTVTLCCNLIRADDRAWSAGAQTLRDIARSALSMTEKQRCLFFLPWDFIQPMAAIKITEFPEILIHSFFEIRIVETNSSVSCSSQPFKVRLEAPRDVVVHGNSFSHDISLTNNPPLVV